MSATNAEEFLRWTAVAAAGIRAARTKSLDYQRSIGSGRVG